MSEPAVAVDNDRKIYSTLEEWLKDGEARFGRDPLQWKFKCPGCGHVQAVIDFRPFKPQGATAESARLVCIGRYAGARRRAFGAPGNGPCDYTSGGLLDIRPVVVHTAEGPRKSFAFADPVDPKGGAQ